MGAFSPDLSTTGAAQTGFTSPTYTLAVDFPPDVNSRQWAVTVAGGTQTGVRTSTAGDPFTQTFRRAPYKALPAKNAVTGAYPNVPVNRTEVLTRKGVKIDSAGTIRVMTLRTIAEIPAGAELNDPANIRGAVSAHEGLMAEEASDFGDTLISGVAG
jgi:hypothetical protein